MAEFPQSGGEGGLDEAAVQALIDTALEAIPPGGGEGGDLEPTWAALELAAGVTAFGAPYSDPRVGVAGTMAFLTGLLNFSEGKAPGATLFTLPPAARPAKKKLVLASDANNVSASALLVLVIETNGAVKAGASYSGSVVPALDPIVYSLTD